jgi:hypothetical protein
MKEISGMYLKIFDMVQGAAGQLLVDTVTAPTPTTKHAKMVRPLLIYFAEFVEERLQNKKERTYSLMISEKREISVLMLFNESRYKTLATLEGSPLQSIG